MKWIAFAMKARCHATRRDAMSRRLLPLACGFAALILALGYGAYYHRSSDISETLDVSAFLDPFSQIENDDDMKSDSPAKILIEIRVLSVPALTAPSISDQPLQGRVKDLHALLRAAQANRKAHIMQSPTCITTSGRMTSVGSHMTRPGFLGDGTTKVQRAHGMETTALPTLRKDGRIHLEVEFTDSTFCGVPPKENCTLPTMKGSFVLNDKETVFMGGLKSKYLDRSPYEVPLLSDLPWIGSWFRVPREVEVDHELLFFATVTIQKSP